MMMKGCHRCGGNVYDEQDLGGTDLVCLHCGYRRTLTAHDVAAEDAEKMVRWLQSQRPNRLAA